MTHAELTIITEYIEKGDRIGKRMHEAALRALRNGNHARAAHIALRMSKLYARLDRAMSVASYIEEMLSK